MKISNLLEKYLKMRPVEGVVKDEVVEKVREVCGMDIERDQVSFSSKVVYISIPPSQKIALMQNKTEIMSTFSPNVQKEVSDIR